MQISLPQKVLLLVSLFVFVIFLGIFRLGVASSVFGADSGDIILSYFFAGVPHPPGYPLNTMLGVILTKIIPGATFAFKANFISAVYSAFSISLVFYLLSRVTRNVVIALAASSVLAFTPLFWLYAHFAEVFQLSSVLVLVSVIFLFEWWVSSGKMRLQPLFIATFFFGLGAFHHHTIILLGPAYLYLAVKAKKIIFKKDRFFKLAAAFLAGALPYLYVFWAARRHTPVNWDDPTTVGNFWRLITRADYGSFSATSDLVGITLAERVKQIVWYFLVIRADFTAFGLVLILAGLIYLFLKKRDWFWFFALAVTFTGPFFLFYASFPLVEPFLQGISERFLLINYLVLTILLAFGMLAAVGTAYRLFPRKVFVLFCSGLFLLFPLVLGLTNFPRADLSRFAAGKTLGADVLLSATPPGIIFLQGDTVTFTSQYSFYVDKLGGDSKILMTGRLVYPSYRQQVMREYPDLLFDDNFKSDKVIGLAQAVMGLVDKNFEKYPIYIVEIVPLPDDKVWVQEGALLRLYKKDDLPDASVIQKNIDEKVGGFIFRPGIFDGLYASFFADHFKNIYARIFTRNGFELLSRNRAGSAIPYFRKTLEFESDYLDARLGLGIAYLTLGDCQKAEQNLGQITALDANYIQAWDALSKVYGDCLGDKARGEEFSRKAQDLRERQFGVPIE
ncbi:MAG: DUF2723 domain-containing protein [Candidatus Curtissbacteria bacterium]|nr:DUF2723 domain-containing protein [Candidatus Curtissbacteria bacterium]